MHPLFTFLKTATIPTYYGIPIAIPRYIAMQLSTVPFIMTRPIIVILLFAWSCSWHCICGKATFIIFHTCHSWFIAYPRWWLYDFIGISFFSHVILRRHDCLISMLEVLLFPMSIWTFILNHLDLNIHATIKKITLRIMLGSIPHKYFCFLSFTYSRTSRN